MTYRDAQATPSASAPPIEITIVGASVRGVSLVDRLLAGAAELLAGHPVHITVFDPHPPGSGRIWRADQPQTLIMNTVAAQSTVFTDATVRCEGEIRPGPSLAQWCRLVTEDPSLADLPAAVAAEAAETLDWSSPSRLLYGYYLRWSFARIVADAPDDVRIDVVPQQVVDLERAASGWSVRTADGARRTAHAVLLAVGWLPRSDIAAHPRVIAPDNPIDQDVDGIGAGELVAVRGLGMGFFDVLSLLTEGRGGAFSADLSRYRASGNEPHLIAGSSRGLPYRAKPAFGAVPFFPAQRALRAALPTLIARRPVDFAADVLPLIERDALHDYYEALARVRPDAVRGIAGLLAGLLAGDPVAPLIARHVPDPADRLSLSDAADPLSAARRADPHAAIDDLVAGIVRADAAEALRGADSPLKLGLHSYAAARGAVIDLVAFGGLTAASFPAYRRFLAVAASFGSGPPLLRARQLIALHDAGIVRFTGPGFRARPGTDGVAVDAPALPTTVHAERLIEAWLPTPTVTYTGDPLLSALVSRGAARAWAHPGAGASDALDISPLDGNVIAADGEAVPGLYSVGVPHEDVRVFTIIAPVPGTNSSVLRETDAAARAALTHAAAAHAQHENEGARHG